MVNDIACNLEVSVLLYLSEAKHVAMAQTDELWDACQSWSYECWDTVCLQANIGVKARQEPKAAACARNYLLYGSAF